MRIAVTGAFGYSGRYITKRLLEAGHEVITLTNSLHRPNPFGEKVTAFPFHFEAPHKLRDSLRGVQALVNTYWVRFDHRLFTHGQAVANTKILFKLNVEQAGWRQRRIPGSVGNRASLARRKDNGAHPIQEQRSPSVPPIHHLISRAREPQSATASP